MIWRATLLLFLSLLIVRPATGAPDYAPESEEWNGFSRFIATAEEAGVHIDVTTNLDWSSVRPTEPLLFVHPHHVPRLDEADAFLQDGGAIILADDFGSGRQWAAHHGIHIDTPPSHALELPGWPHPSISPPLEGFLGFNIQAAGGRIFLNHPATARTQGDIEGHLRIPGRDGLVLLEKEVGAGTFQVLTDPSIWINTMMLNHPNKQLAANVLRRHCHASPCKVRLILPSYDEEGADRPRGASRGMVEALVGFIGRFRLGLLALQDRMGTPGGSKALLVGLLLVLLLVCPPLLRGRIVPTPGGGSHPASPGSGATLSEAFTTAWERAEFTIPARGALRSLLRMLTASEHASLGIESERPRLAHRLARRLAPDAPAPLEAAALRAFDFLPILERNPPSDTSAHQRVTGEDFLTLCEAVDRLLNASRGTP